MEKNMNNRLIQFGLVAAIAGAFAAPVFAQTTQTETQRDLNQQNRIESGLQSGQLSTKEAGQLERGEARVEKMQSNADRNGSLSPREQARIQRAQNRESAAIARDKSNGVTGNPNSASSQRMQADVQRNANQQARIEQGEKSGQLSTHEAGSLERGQARTDRAIARSAANGHVNANEQARIQNRENRQSARVFNKKHNGTVS
jgi:hypothetical protein